MKSNQRKIAIIGLGYVGLPLLVTCAQSGWLAIGVDSNPSKIKDLSQGRSSIEDISDRQIQELLEKGHIQFSSSETIIEEAEVIVFCLPTPILNKRPDLTILLSAIRSYAPYFKDGALIVSESSSYPGTLRHEIVPICENFKENKRFYYGHSPERVDPGNRTWNNSNTPRIISGLDHESLNRMREFYESFCESLVEVDTPEIAEAAKMFENSFRQVNIALVNEFARYCHEVGISARKVLDAASTKPFGFMKFNYGAGVGGHCIPVDPYYLVDHAIKNKTQLKLIELSNEINDLQPSYVLARASSLLDSGLKKSKILVVGLSYKANTSDQRESPGIQLLALAKKEGAEVEWYEPMMKGNQFEREGSSEATYALAIVVTLHDGFDYSRILQNCDKILDCTNTLACSQKVFQL